MGSIWHRLRRQRGFTLIELLAVMAIIAILAAIVAPAVSGTKNTSNEAQANEDSSEVRTAASKFFSDQNTSEVSTSDSVTSPIGVKVGKTDGEAYTGSNTATTTVTKTQKTSSRWPELFITNSSTSSAIYYLEFATSTSADIDTVYVTDKDDKLIGLDTLFDGYTAVDTATLVSKNYMAKKPSSADSTATLGSTAIHQFLWLFKKTKSSGSSTFDNRELFVFKLESATQVSIPNGTLPALTKYILKYRRVS